MTLSERIRKAEESNRQYLLRQKQEDADLQARVRKAEESNKNYLLKQQDTRNQHGASGSWEAETPPTALPEPIEAIMSRPPSGRYAPSAMTTPTFQDRASTAARITGQTATRALTEGAKGAMAGAPRGVGVGFMAGLPIGAAPLGAALGGAIGGVTGFALGAGSSLGGSLAEVEVAKQRGEFSPQTRSIKDLNKESYQQIENAVAQTTAAVSKKLEQSWRGAIDRLWELPLAASRNIENPALQAAVSIPTYAAPIAAELAGSAAHLTKTGVTAVMELPMTLQQIAFGIGAAVLGRGNTEQSLGSVAAEAVRPIARSLTRVPQAFQFGQSNLANVLPEGVREYVSKPSPTLYELVTNEDIEEVYARIRGGDATMIDRVTLFASQVGEMYADPGYLFTFGKGFGAQLTTGMREGRLRDAEVTLSRAGEITAGKARQERMDSLTDFIDVRAAEMMNMRPQLTWDEAHATAKKNVAREASVAFADMADRQLQIRRDGFYEDPRTGERIIATPEEQVFAKAFVRQNLDTGGIKIRYPVGVGKRTAESSTLVRWGERSLIDSLLLHRIADAFPFKPNEQNPDLFTEGGKEMRRNQILAVFDTTRTKAGRAPLTVIRAESLRKGRLQYLTDANLAMIDGVMREHKLNSEERRLVFTALDTGTSVANEKLEAVRAQSEDTVRLGLEAGAALRNMVEGIQSENPLIGEAEAFLVVKAARLGKTLDDPDLQDAVTQFRAYFDENLRKAQAVGVEVDEALGGNYVVHAPLSPDYKKWLQRHSEEFKRHMDALDDEDLWEVTKKYRKEPSATGKQAIQKHRSLYLWRWIEGVGENLQRYAVVASAKYMATKPTMVERLVKDSTARFADGIEYAGERLITIGRHLDVLAGKTGGETLESIRGQIADTSRRVAQLTSVERRTAGQEKELRALGRRQETLTRRRLNLQAAQTQNIYDPAKIRESIQTELANVRMMAGRLRASEATLAKIDALEQQANSIKYESFVYQERIDRTRGADELGTDVGSAALERAPIEGEINVQPEPVYRTTSRRRPVEEGASVGEYEGDLIQTRQPSDTVAVENVTARKGAGRVDAERKRAEKQLAGLQTALDDLRKDFRDPDTLDPIVKMHKERILTLNKDLTKALHDAKARTEVEKIERNIATTQGRIAELAKLGDKELLAEARTELAGLKVARTAARKASKEETQARIQSETIQRLSNEIANHLDAIFERLPVDTGEIHVRRSRRTKATVPLVGDNVVVSKTGERVSVLGHEVLMDNAWAHAVALSEGTVRDGRGAPLWDAIGTGDISKDNIRVHVEDDSGAFRTIPLKDLKAAPNYGHLEVYTKEKAFVDEVNDQFGPMFDDDIVRSAAYYGKRSARMISNQEFVNALVEEGYARPASEVPNSHWVGYEDTMKRPGHGIAAFKDYYLPKNVAEYILKSWDAESGMGGNMRALHWLTKLWKASVTKYFPAFHGQNAISNVAFNYSDMGGAVMSGAMWGLSAKLMKMNHESEKYRKDISHPQKRDAARVGLDALNQTVVLTDVGGKQWTFGELQQALKESDVAFTGTNYGILDLDTPLYDDIRSATEWAKQYDKGIPVLRQAGRTVKKVSDFATHVGVGIEEQARLLNFMTHLRETGDVVNSAERTKLFLLDYKSLTKAEKQGLRLAIPFYTFMKKNMILQAKVLAKTPGRIAFQAHLLNVVESLAQPPMTDWEEERTQDYVRENLGIVLEREGGGLNLVNTVGLPFQSAVASALHPIRTATSGLNPLIKTPLELLTDYRFFTGRQAPEKVNVSEIMRVAGFANKPFAAELARMMKVEVVSEVNVVDGAPKRTQEYFANDVRMAYLIQNLPPISRFWSEMRKFNQPDWLTMKTVFEVVTGGDITYLDSDSMSHVKRRMDALTGQERKSERNIRRTLRELGIKEPRPEQLPEESFGRR